MKDIIKKMEDAKTKKDIEDVQISNEMDARDKKIASLEEKIIKLQNNKRINAENAKELENTIKKMEDSKQKKEIEDVKISNEMDARDKKIASLEKKIIKLRNNKRIDAENAKELENTIKKMEDAKTKKDIEDVKISNEMDARDKKIASLEKKIIKLRIWKYFGVGIAISAVGFVLFSVYKK